MQPKACFRLVLGTSDFNHGVLGSSPSALTTNAWFFSDFLANPAKRNCVTAVTSRRLGSGYKDDDGFRPLLRRAPMTAMKKTGKRFARWFKQFRENNKPPFRYYEHSLYDA